MQGELLRTGAPGVLRRSVLDLSAGRLSTERHEDLDDQEFPAIAPDRVGRIRSKNPDAPNLSTASSTNAVNSSGTKRWCGYTI